MTIWGVKSSSLAAESSIGAMTVKKNPGRQVHTSENPALISDTEYCERRFWLKCLVNVYEYFRLESVLAKHTLQDNTVAMHAH